MSPLFLSVVALAISTVALLISLHVAFSVRKPHPQHFVDFSKLQRPRQPTENRPYVGADAFRKLAGAPEPPPAVSTSTDDLRQNLRLKFLYQEDKIDGAIEFERDRNPSADADTLMRAAIARWERDNQ